MLDESRFASVREFPEADGSAISYIGRILRLMLLAPDIIERTLDGRPAPQLAQPFPHRVAKAAGAVPLSGSRRSLLSAAGNTPAAGTSARRSARHTIRR
jgi:hypothetical protein